MEIRLLGVNDESHHVRIAGEDHRWMQLFGLTCEMSFAQQVHLMLAMLRLRVEAAKASAELPLEMTGDVYELGMILLLGDLRLLLPHEMARALTLADEMSGVDVQTRLRGLAQLANERLGVLAPAWQRQREAAAAEYRQWTAEHALGDEKRAAVFN